MIKEKSKNRGKPIKRRKDDICTKVYNKYGYKI